MSLWFDRRTRDKFFTDFLTPNIETLSESEIQFQKDTITESKGYIANRKDIPEDQFYVIVRDEKHSSWGCPKVLGLTNYMIFHTNCSSEAKDLIKFFRDGVSDYDSDIQYIQYRENIPFFDDNGNYDSSNYYSLFENNYEQNTDFYRRAYEFIHGDEDE